MATQTTKKPYNCLTSNQNPPTVDQTINRATLIEIEASPFIEGNGSGFVVVDDKPVDDPLEAVAYGDDTLHRMDVADLTAEPVEEVRVELNVELARARICERNRWDLGICRQIFAWMTQSELNFLRDIVTA